MRTNFLLRSIVLALAVMGFVCTPPDPVHDRAVEQLGEETGNADEFHRAGQPCTTCHNSKNGPADTDFSVGGTVFANRTSLMGVDGVRVELTDSAGTSPPPVLTNCVGNFFIPRSAWDPVLPITSVRMTKGTQARSMLTPIGGTGSCADCHVSKIAPENPLTKLGIVYLFDGAPPPGPAVSCPVNPELGK